ncbi:MAG: hypothetical protein ABSA13_15595 [Beijerinckiaceae bacterium]|jgi:hypothetical protein
MSALKMRSPVPRANAENRAECLIRSDFVLTIGSPEGEVDFASIYLARRFGLSMPIAQTIAALAYLGRAML